MGNSLKRKDLTAIIKQKKGFPSSYSKKIVDDLIFIICDNIKSGFLNIKNLGSFKTRLKNERLGRNPKTKKSYIIKSRLSIIFIPSKKLIKKINNF